MITGTAIRQHSRILIEHDKIPAGYIALADLVDLLAGDLDPNIEILGRYGEDRGRATLSRDGRLLILEIRDMGGRPHRSTLLTRHARDLIAGRTWRALTLDLPLPGDPTVSGYRPEGASS